MKSLKTKVILSAVVLVFAFIATIGTTYAWFTITNTVEVTSFDINVESSEALLIRVWDEETLVDGQTYDQYSTSDDGVNYWTLDDFSNSVDITDSDVYNGGTQDISSALLSPVTGFYGETTTGDTDYSAFQVVNLRKPDATFLSDPTARTYDTASYNTSGGGYIQIKLWVLKPAGDNTNVTFDYTIDDGQSETYENTIFFGTYEQVADGTTSNENVFGEELDASFTWASASVPGYDETESSTMNSIEGTAAATALTAATGTTDSTSVISLPTANVPELLTINIWAEGWDEDCVNAIMGATFSITFELILVV
ncbi:MAG: hypothetical protein PQJ44_08040 [Sphaerochaetaceae bacterium]|nr:hypothetical protein [Sphaerochaetaceae bacterium]